MSNTIPWNNEEWRLSGREISPATEYGAGEYEPFRNRLNTASRPVFFESSAGNLQNWMPEGFDWGKEGVQDIGDYSYKVHYKPGSTSGSDENFAYNYDLVDSVLRAPRGQLVEGGTYDILNPTTGQQTNRGHWEQSGSFFGDLFETATGLAKEFAPLATMAIGAGPLGGMIGSAAASGLGLTGLTAAQTAALGSAIGSGGITALSGGDIGDVLKSAAMAGAPQVIPKDLRNAINAARAIDAGNPLALLGIASSYLPGPTMPGAGISEDIQEGFFEPGGPGFSPTEYLGDAEVDRELRSLLGRYPAPFASTEVNLPTGNLEQDFFVAQTKQGPRIVDSAGNIGTFVNGEFVVDTGVTPDLSYAATGNRSSGEAPRRTAVPRNTAVSGSASSGFDPSLLFALGAMMTPQQQKKEEQQMAPVHAVQSPFGMDLLV